MQTAWEGRSGRQIGRVVQCRGRPLPAVPLPRLPPLVGPSAGPRGRPRLGAASGEKRKGRPRFLGWGRPTLPLMAAPQQRQQGFQQGLSPLFGRRVYGGTSRKTTLSAALHTFAFTVTLSPRLMPASSAARPAVCGRERKWPPSCHSPAPAPRTAALRPGVRHRQGDFQFFPLSPTA